MARHDVGTKRFRPFRKLKQPEKYQKDGINILYNRCACDNLLDDLTKIIYYRLKIYALK